MNSEQTNNTATNQHTTVLKASLLANVGEYAIIYSFFNKGVNGFDRERNTVVASGDLLGSPKSEQLNITGNTYRTPFNTRMALAA